MKQENPLLVIQGHEICAIDDRKHGMHILKVALDQVMLLRPLMDGGWKRETLS